MVSEIFLPTNAELAILSLLAEQPMHGYQIEQTIESRGMREWTAIGFSSIYYILNKLRKLGLVVSRQKSAPGKGPSRQVFALTRLGQKCYQKAALNSLANPSRTFSNFSLGLAAIPGLPSAEVLSALHNYHSFLMSKKSALEKKIMSYGFDLPVHVSAMFERDLLQLKCELDWLDGYLANLETQSSK